MAWSTALSPITPEVHPMQNLVWDNVEDHHHHYKGAKHKQCRYNGCAVQVQLSPEFSRISTIAMTSTVNLKQSLKAMAAMEKAAEHKRKLHQLVEEIVNGNDCHVETIDQALETLLALKSFTIHASSSQTVEQSLLDRVQRLTGRPLPVFLRRGVFFAHRDFNKILDIYEGGEKFVLYTGRGPSSESLHLGHLVPFMFTKLTAFLVSPVKIMSENKVIHQFRQWHHFSNTFPRQFPGNDHLHCLIPCAIDQDPYFRMTRDVAPRIGYLKPALIESSFFPALQGEHRKVSASDPNSAIYVTDSAKVIKKKINQYAFSGGQESVQEHRKPGANLEEYGEGRMLTGEVKQRLTEVLTEVVERHQRARAAVTEEMVDVFMTDRPLVF
ncbi:hypothetical protein QYF36_007905 [Acer negundo]|nr:hypothetical protein QYF36_007905 [Acer negundo]